MRVGMLFLLAFAVMAQEKPVIKYAPPEQVPAADGTGMFHAYCAVCHGSDGRGGGPAADALKKRPADLTQLSRRNNGKFPVALVKNTIQGTDVVAAHGSRDMPIWGAVFRSLGGGDAMVQLRVANLTTYLDSLQRK